MIRKMLLVFLCFTLFLSIPGCKKKLPPSPDLPDSEANFILVSSNEGYTLDHRCEITGAVENIGEATGVNVKIIFEAYDASDVIIGAAPGFPAVGEAIPAGVIATFKATFLDLYDWDVIERTTYEITWETR